MKNIEIVNALNNLNTFVEHQRASRRSFLNVKGQFAIKANNEALMAKYKPYMETLNELKERYGIKDGVEVDNDVFTIELQDLLNIEVEDITLTKVSDKDFFDGVTIDDIMLLDFMIG